MKERTQIEEMTGHSRNNRVGVLSPGPYIIGNSFLYILTCKSCVNTFRYGGYTCFQISEGYVYFTKDG